MPIRASLTLRWTRAVAVGGVAFTAGVGAHTSANGLLPGPVGLAFLAVACAIGSALFLGFQASPYRLVALVIAGQGFVHTGLAALAGHRGDPVSPAVDVTFHPTVVSGPRTGSYYDQWAQANPAGHGGAGPAVPSWVVHSVADLAQQPLMALGHLLAAVAVGLWLAVGERALWALITLSAAWAVHLVRRLRTALVDGLVPVAPRLPALRRTATSRVRPLLNVWARGPVRRGPPRLLTAH